MLSYILSKASVTGTSPSQDTRLAGSAFDLTGIFFLLFLFFFTFFYSETLEEEMQCTCLEPMHIFSPKFTHALLCVQTYPVFAFLSCPRN